MSSTTKVDRHAPAKVINSIKMHKWIYVHSTASPKTSITSHLRPLNHTNVHKEVILLQQKQTEKYCNLYFNQWIILFITYWQHSEECMCCLWNIAMRDYQESVTTGQTDGRTDRRTERQMSDKVIHMCRYASQATQKLNHIHLLIQYFILNVVTATCNDNLLFWYIPWKFT